jgi:IMP dehydrogenase
LVLALSDSKMFIDGKTYIGYRGMGSEGAMNDGSGDRYSQEGSSKFVPEGIEGCVPYRGMVEDTIYQMVGGLKSAMGYVGARNISELQGRGLSYYHMDGFVRVSPNALAENHPHDIHNIKEAPNYA